MASIAESPTSIQHESRWPTRQQPTGNRPDRGLFNSATHARPDHAPTDPNRQFNHAGRTAQPAIDSQYPASSSNAVLGKIQNLKAGVFGSNGLQRPLQQSRSGPIQTYDPRATMVPIRIDDASSNSSRRRPAPPRLQDVALHRHTEDARSIISDQSGRSLQSKRSVESSRQQQGELFAASLSPTDAGPFHHVSSKLDPARFVPADVPIGPSKSHGKKVKSRGGRSYDTGDHDWEDEGYDGLSSIDNGSSYSRNGSRPSRSAGTTMSNRSNDEDYSARDYRQAPHRQDPRDQARAHDAERASSSSLTARQARSAQTSLDKSARVERPNDTGPARIRPDRPPMTRAPSPQGSNESRNAHALPTIHVAHSRHDGQNKTHARNETSSSLGTVLTNASLFSARSSVSSPPSEVSYQSKGRDVQCRAQAHTPTPQDYENEATPTLRDHGQPKPYPSRGNPAAAAGITRSTTTGSFDRLLEDIGSSIDGLKVPAPDLAAGQASPSSNYSPIVPAEPFPRPSPGIRVPQGLGSPASLASKETASSKGSRSSRTRTRTRTKESRCMACGHVISGKWVASADGAVSGRYHRSCFTCADATCTQAGFPDGQFYVHRDRPYCARHYHALAGTLCALCGEGIEGDCLATRTDERYHLHCHAAQQVDGRQYRHF
ncbi:Paxillin-like protein [Taphrina deformans PYCC 5710]|uniref:Paxillin-like protein n=1 Tax=Taphrina deformans (strain PYCC 5710 / ATCC 11124 / CBS 356.35 / IMI 108563 / JCM 9778 / NBRC 8474) TaxID=1097556 RepID=R4XD92_TAPDE|nr:Paxillin-like protein [Taphrina deformans PYCC 5710]|eukprot:CCG83563.1 Paxillin-like protein [Taphrina deformans PYCC 5710]